MSILIKGMEMPQGCVNCPFSVFKICLINRLTEGKQTVTHSCPLVPVPDHGRLIDADALKAKQQEDADLFQNAYTLMEKRRRDEALNAVANIVNAPTIIPADKEGEG